MAAPYDVQLDDEFGNTLTVYTNPGDDVSYFLRRPDGDFAMDTVIYHRVRKLTPTSSLKPIQTTRIYLDDKGGFIYSRLDYDHPLYVKSSDGWFKLSHHDDRYAVYIKHAARVTVPED